VPHVTFLGTHFENLRVGGYPVEVELDLGFVAKNPRATHLTRKIPAFLIVLNGNVPALPVPGPFHRAPG